MYDIGGNTHPVSFNVYTIRWPHTPQQNVVAQRKNRTPIDTAWQMPHEKSPKMYWPVDVAPLASIQNRLPPSEPKKDTLPEMEKQEARLQQQQSVWLYYAHVSGIERRNVDKTAVKLCFMKCANNAKGSLPVWLRKEKDFHLLLNAGSRTHREQQWFIEISALQKATHRCMVLSTTRLFQLIKNNLLKFFSKWKSGRRNLHGAITMIHHHTSGTPSVQTVRVSMEEE